MTDPVLPMSEHLVPGWLQRLAAIGWRVLVTLALALVLVHLAIVLSTVTVAILIALVIAATFAPYVASRRARGWSRTKAAGVASLLALGSVVGVLVVLAIIFFPYVRDVIMTVRAGGEAIESWLTDGGVSPVVAGLVHEVIDAVRTMFATAAADIVAPIAALVTSLILGGFTLFFLLQDGDRAWAWLIDPVKGWRAEAMTESGKAALERVGGYLRGTTVLAAINAISAFAFMVILGIPTAGPLAVLVFVGAYVPYVGGVLTTLAILLVALASGGVSVALTFLGLIVVRNLIVSNLVRPRIYGRSLGIHPALVLVALPIGAALFGAVGLFMALPVLAFVIAFGPAVILALGARPGGAHDRPGLVPVWLDRLGQWSWRSLVGLGLAAAVVAAALRLPLVVIPIVLAVVLAATLDPATDALVRRGWPRGRAAVVTTLGSILAIIGISLVAIAMMVGPLEEMLSTAETGASQGLLGNAQVATVVHAVRSGALSAAGGFLAELPAFGVILLLATLLTYYLLRDGEGAGLAVLDRFGGPRRADLQRVGERAVDVLGGYMIATGIISLFGACTTWLLMVILGLPLALPIAVLSFFLGFIPYIGSFIATALAFLVTVAVGTTTDIAVMAIFTIVFNIAQGNFVAPLVYGRAVSLHPAVVLLAIPAGNAVAGVMGMFLVVPFLGVVAVSWRTVLGAFAAGGTPGGDATASDATASDATASDASGSTLGGSPPDGAIAGGTV